MTEVKPAALTNGNQGTGGKGKSNGEGGFLAMIRTKKVSQLNIFLLASNIIIGSLIDIDFSAGYWMLLFNAILSGVGYILLACSLAEMTSALPFSGGIYGIVRAFLHPFLGFYACIFELMINLFYIALSVQSLSLLPFQSGTVADDSTVLVFCLVSYIVVAGVCMLGGKVFWWTNDLLGVVCIAIICLYILAATPYADFSSVSHAREPFSMEGIMKALPGPSLTYLGIQYLPLNSKFTKDPKTDVPYVMIATVAIIFALCIGVITLANSQDPGYDELAIEDHPLTFGFSNALGITVPQAHFLGFPGLFANCFTFIYCFGRQSSSMANSGLLPEIFKREIPVVHTPYFALITVSLICFIMNIFLFYFEEILGHLYLGICGLSTYIVFISFFIAYIQFRRNYSSLQRSVYSPFGIGGAIAGILIFALCGIAEFAFMDHGYIELIFIVIVTLLILGVFKFVLKSHEFSEEEKNELFKAYLITANRESKNRVLKRAKNRSSASSAASGSAAGKSSSISQHNRSSNGGRDSDIEANSENGKSDADSESIASADQTRPASLIDDPSTRKTQSRMWSHVLTMPFQANKVQPASHTTPAN